MNPPPDAAGADPIVLRGDGWVVARKPPGLPTDADPAVRTDSFRARLARALDLPFRLLHPHTRLDLPVAGLTLWSHDDGARRRLLDATARGAVRKLYLAVAAETPRDERIAWPAERAPWRTRRGRPLPVRPETRVVPVARTATAVLLAAGISAGKHHQIRVHLAGAGAPLLGDRRHGGPPRVTAPDGRVLALPFVALESCALRFPDRHDRTVGVASAPTESVRDAAAWAGIDADHLGDSALHLAWRRVWGEALDPAGSPD
jgi:23S rRNA-/tRNA-specific pseudouridylate synthase